MSELLYMSELTEVHHYFEDWLKSFLYEDNPYVIRLHISHTDLDGYACSIIMQSYDNKVGSDKSRIYRMNVNAGAENIQKGLESFFTRRPHTYRKGSTQLKILVTDLSNVYPEIFDRYIKAGHRITYAVADHHLDLNHCAEMVKNPQENPYLVISDPDHYISAATILNYFCKRIAGDVSPALDEYVSAVGRYDTGHWGKWNVDTIEEIAPSTAEQMFFSMFRTRYQKVSYFDAMFRYVNHPHSKESAGIGNYRRRRIREVLVSMKKEYKHIVANMKPMYDLAEGYADIFRTTFGKLNLHAINAAAYVDDDSYPINNLTLVSREILDNHPEIDLFALIDVDRAIELRSKSPIISCAEIATMNGGGGHKGAAGFPLPEHLIQANLQSAT